MVLKKLEDSVFKRELQSILDRIENFGELYDERIKKAAVENEEIQNELEEKSPAALFGKQSRLVSSLNSLLVEAEPTFKAIRTSVLTMKRELDKGRFEDDDADGQED